MTIPLGLYGAARPVAAGGPILLDTFTRPDGPLRGTTADTGQLWEGNNDGYIITSGTAKSSLFGADNYATVPTGISDFTLTASCAFASGTTMLCFRTPASGTFANILGVELTATTILLRKKVTGPFTTLTSSTHSDISATTVAVQVVANGPTIDVSINGTPLLTHTTTDYQTQKGIGLYNWQSSNNRWDNITVEAL